MIGLLAALAVLLAIVLVFVFVPLARGGGRARSREALARAVYRDQLGELDRELERAVVAPGEAGAARREIERRLIASAEVEPGAPSRRAPVLAASLAVAVALVAAALYATVGAPGVRDRPYADRQAERAVAEHRMPPDLDKAVADLEERLAANPNNLDGWLLLGRTEAAREHWQKSAEAMRHAMTLAKDRADIAAGYGVALVMADGGMVTPAARDAFAAALAAEPTNPEALWYLGLAAVQGHEPNQARGYWRRLMDSLPADSEDRKNVAAALDALDRATGAGASGK
jgi:cytochrome c-type biogenesis protein CcmH